MTQASTLRTAAMYPSAHGTAEPTTVAEAPRHVGVLIIGSGFSGLAAAIRLTKDGRPDFLVVERGSEVGGTWRDNTYPGAACDVPSRLYSYSFEQNPDWSRSFSPQHEIQDYLRRTARKYDVLDKHLFDTEVTSARWDDGAARWVVETTRGTFTADVLVGAIGALCEPALPDIKGIHTFQGEIFHSARWDHDSDLTGKRVAVIGTGASAIQIVPAIADQVAHLDVYQRTAPWIIPRHDRAYSTWERRAYKYVPGLQWLARQLIYWGRELMVLGFAVKPKLLLIAQHIATRHIRRQIEDEDLRATVTPTWQIGCKRVLISNDWYPTLIRDDVELVTDGIAEVRGNAIVTEDGTVREVDAIIVATGFHVTDSPAHEAIKGSDGRSLAQLWREHGRAAYKGAAVAGFPNLLFLVGPNTGLGHTSMIYMIEAQVNYLASALDEMDEYGLATFDVREDRQRAFNLNLQKQMKHTVWTTGGCASWYLDARGNNTTLWPGFTFTYRRLTRKFDLGAYRTTARADRTGSSLPITEEAGAA